MKLTKLPLNSRKTRGIRMELEKYKDAIYTCNRTRCGFCREECPVFKEKKLETYACRGKMLIARGMLEGIIPENEYEEITKIANTCSVCGSCAANCALDNDEILEALRADLVKKGYTDENHLIGINSILEKENPFQLDREDKTDWAEGIEFNKQSPILFYAGCTDSLFYPERLEKTVRILKKLGIEMNYLGSDEPCCGELMHTTGHWNKFRAQIEKTEKLFREAGVKTIVTHCPGCLRTFRDKYPKFYEKFDFEVIHVIQIIAKEIESGKITFKKPVNMKVTYHDPCHLGRLAGIIEEPRTILNAIPGIELIEMPHIGYQSHCCGGGGGLMAVDYDLVANLTDSRLKEAEETGAEYLVTICPTCEFNFDKAIRNYNIKLLDVMDIIEMAID
jgi:heterodisulfide reductase subunit D